MSPGLPTQVRRFAKYKPAVLQGQLLCAAFSCQKGRHLFQQRCSKVSHWDSVVSRKFKLPFFFQVGLQHPAGVRGRVAGYGGARPDGVHRSCPGATQAAGQLSGGAIGSISPMTSASFEHSSWAHECPRTPRIETQYLKPATEHCCGAPYTHPFDTPLPRLGLGLPYPLLEPESFVKTVEGFRTEDTALESAQRHGRSMNLGNLQQKRSPRWILPIKPGRKVYRIFLVPPAPRPTVVRTTEAWRPTCGRPCSDFRLQLHKRIGPQC